MTSALAHAKESAATRIAAHAWFARLMSIPTPGRGGHLRGSSPSSRYYDVEARASRDPPPRPEEARDEEGGAPDPRNHPRPGGRAPPPLPRGDRHGKGTDDEAQRRRTERQDPRGGALPHGSPLLGSSLPRCGWCLRQASLSCSPRRSVAARRSSSSSRACQSRARFSRSSFRWASLSLTPPIPSPSRLGPRRAPFIAPAEIGEGVL